jgi:hypothetical protein
MAKNANEAVAKAEASNKVLPKEDCSTCKFSRNRVTSSVVLSCCKNVPSLLISNPGNFQQLGGVWPLVEPQDWCGEYRRKRWAADSEGG